jgi:hypothetical protein
MKVDTLLADNRESRPAAAAHTSAEAVSLTLLLKQNNIQLGPFLDSRILRLYIIFQQKQHYLPRDQLVLLLELRSWKIHTMKDIKTMRNWIKNKTFLEVVNPPQQLQCEKK